MKQKKIIFKKLNVEEKSKVLGGGFTEATGCNGSKTESTSCNPGEVPGLGFCG